MVVTRTQRGIVSDDSMKKREEKSEKERERDRWALLREQVGGGRIRRTEIERESASEAEI